MKSFKQVATERPILFSIVITISFLAFYIVARIPAAMLASDDVS